MSWKGRLGANECVGNIVQPHGGNILAHTDEGQQRTLEALGIRATHIRHTETYTNLQTTGSTTETQPYNPEADTSQEDTKLAGKTRDHKGRA